MASAKQIIRQRDFSGGEVVEHAKRRDDEPAVRSGARTLRNVRILASGAVEQRPGRSAQFAGAARADEVRLTSEITVFLCFGDDGSLSIRSSAGVVLGQAWGYDWDEDTSWTAVWALYNKDIVITFDGQVPKIARWDGTTIWTFLDWAPTTTSAGRQLLPFVRFAPPGVTMALSAVTGTVTVTFSDDVLNASHVDARFRYYDKQILISAVASPTSGTAIVQELLRGISTIDFTAAVTSIFAVGDVIEGATTGGIGYVAQVGTPGSDDITMIHLNSQSFNLAAGEDVVGPSGTAEFSSGSLISTGPAITVWDEELMNDYRGWPRSVSVDQNRLIFCDFPGMPEAVCWSASGDHHDFATGLAEDADPADAICEFVPKKARVYHVLDGADEFVFTDLGIYYVPISESNPLRPGSVGFRRIPGAPASQVRPVSTAQGLVYANKARNRVLAIIGTGQTAQPYLVRPASDLQSHLFEDITCLAIEEGGGDPPDELVYAVNGDGTVVVGRYEVGKDWAGWVKWEGDGEVRWVSAASNAALFTTEYDAGWLAERVNIESYLDASVDYDAIPAALAVGLQANVAIADDQGTLIGDMTAAGGLAAAFDGAAEAAATSASRTTVTTGAVGKTLGQPFRIVAAQVWPSTDTGFSTQTPVAVTIRGKNGAAPSNYASEGTEIGNSGNIADTTAMVTVSTTDSVTEWDHVWILLQSASGNLFISEVRFLAPGATHGTGELWFLASSTVDIMDTLRVVGAGAVDSAGEVTSSGVTFTTQQVGYGFDVTIEPFVPHVGPGQAAGQTHTPRQIPKLAVAVQNSTGFKVQSWKPNESEWSTRFIRAAYGSVTDNGSLDRVTATQLAAQPVAREEVALTNIEGSDIDPRVRVIKDYPGPLRVLEIGPEVGA